MRTIRISLAAAAVVATGALSLAFANATTLQQALADVVAAYTALTPMPDGTGLTVNEAEEVQRLLVTALKPRLGEVAGYKAALTSAAAQARFGVSAPVTGVLLENMFTSTGATFDRGAAVRPVLEADLLVRVADESINDADTEDAVLAALSEVIPYVEIPDLMYTELGGLTGPDVVAINAGARFGVVGVPVPLAQLDDIRERLGSFAAELTDGASRVLARGEGRALMGHPLTAALWLKNEVVRQGYRLKRGDLLSLGALGAPVALDGLERVTATYRGLSAEPLEIHLGVR